MQDTKRARALLFGASTIALMVSETTTSRAQSVPLDPITVLATKTEEKAIDSLAAVSTVRQEQIDQLAPGKVSDIFFGMPGCGSRSAPTIWPPPSTSAACRTSDVSP